MKIFQKPLANSEKKCRIYFGLKKADELPHKYSEQILYPNEKEKKLW